MSACLSDTQTFQLLASGDTTGLGQLEDDDVRDDLRQKKPRSLEALAAILVRSSLSVDLLGAEAVYEEDRMLELRSVLGIGLTDARRLLHSIGRWDGTADQHRTWFIETVGGRGMPASDATDRWRDLRDEAQRTRFRSAMFERAYRCLKAAYFKAHYPEEFAAVASARADR
jgi:hypothetical protein